MPRHHQHRDSRGGFICEQLATNLVAGRVRQAVIKKNEIGSQFFRDPQAVGAGRRGRDLQIGIKGREDVGDEDQQHVGIIDVDGLTRVE